MRRQISLLVVCGVFAAVAGMGCGSKPNDASTRPGASQGTQQTAPPTGAATAVKTYTRKEIKDWLEPKPDSRGVLIPKTAADVKKAFGLPDSTREVKRTDPNYANSLVVTFTEYTYKRASVDADGSGKTDAKLLIYFRDGGTCHTDMTEFIP